MIREKRKITYLLERKPVKNINLRIRSDGSIHISAPAYVPEEYVDAFVISKSRWIQTALEKQKERREKEETPERYEEGEIFRIFGKDRILRFSEGEAEGLQLERDTLRVTLRDTENREYRKRMTEQYLDRLCMEIFVKKVREFQKLLEPYGVEMPSVRIRRMKTRWGSCMPRKGVVTLNRKLLEVPEEAGDYVVLHELCHFLRPDHSPEFYRLVSRFMPDWKKRKEKLSV